MSNGTERDWGLIYETIGDGSMIECPGERCPSSCCAPKKWQCNDNLVYRTCFMGEDELHYQNRMLYPLEKLGVRLVRVYPVQKNADPFPHGRISPVFMMDGCSDLKKGCKLHGRKPFVCRMYPIGLRTSELVAKSCPEVVDIFDNSEIISRMLEVRRLFGCQDDREWLSAVSKCIEGLRKRVRKAV